jgi:4-carboxymuconolactone decarboxylase
MPTKKELGREVVRSMLGEKHVEKFDVAENSTAFGADMTQIALESAFGAIWARPGLDRKCRSMVTIGVLVALHYPEELKNHIRAAITNGFTPKEVEEAIMQTIPYAGFPAASQAMNVARAVLSSLGLIGDPP